MEPMRPKIVADDDAATLQFVSRVTVIAVAEKGRGLLCPMILVSKRGLTISKGLVPFLTPNRSEADATMALLETGESIPPAALTVAAREMVGDACSTAAFWRRIART